MRFLAQTELGSIAPKGGGEAVPDLRAAVDLPGENESLPRYDGVLDLELTADYHHPLSAMRITGARMNGVAPAMAQSLGRTPLGGLLEKGVVIRVRFRAPGVAVMRVTAVFDGDRIDFDDRTAAAGDTSRWLSKLGGYVGAPSPERQRLGVLALRDWLRDARLDQVGLVVKTDHAG
jgi:hypothetical protein